MAEMGILDLEVQVNLEHVEQNLGRLTEALRNVKEKVGDGIKLSGISTQILKICKAVDDGITGSTIIKLGEFGDALSKLKGLGDIKINFNTNNGLTHVVESVSTEANGIETIATTAGEEFERVESFIENIDKEVIGVKKDIGDVIPDLKKLVDAGTFKSWDYGPLPIGTNVADAVRGNKQSYAERIGLKPQAQNPIETEAEKLEKIKKMFGDSSESVQKAIAEIYHIDPAIFNDFKAKMQETADTLERVKSSTDGVKSVDAVAENARTFEDCASKIEACTDKTEELKETEEEAEEETHRLRDAFRDFKSGMQNMFPSLNGLIKKFAQIAKYRMLRTVLKYITSGFSEGVQNVYQYSKAIGSSFAPSMDSAATSILQMKNSIGAAVAPLIQSLIPVLQKVVDWFITLVNYVNQFFALMRGQATWTRAVPATTTAFGKQEKAAKGAANAMKDLLADWDELNIIQSQTSGAGSGLGTSDVEEYLNMFEEVATFNSDIKKVVDFLKNNFDVIKDVATAIGAIILGWKVSKAFKGTLADLASLALPIAVVLDVGIRTAALLANPDVSAISEEALKDNIVSSLETGAVAGYLMKKAGFSTGTSIAGGVAAALITFGVLTGLKADVYAVQNENIDSDYIKSKALESLSLAAGIGTIAKALVPDVTLTQAFGFGTAASLATVLITMGATIGIVATAKAVESGITEQTIYDDLLSSLSTGLGSTILIKMVTASTWAASAAGGVGVGLITLSALVGVQATCEAVANGEITQDTLIADAVSSIGAGAGIAIVGSLITSSIGGAIMAGGLGALAVFGVLVATQAILSMNDEEPIKWGETKLTQEQVQDFVSKELFTVNINATAEIIDKNIAVSETQKQNIETKLTEALGTFNVIKLGLGTNDDYKTLHDQIVGEDGNGGLIGEVGTYIQQAKETGKLTLQFTPSLVGSDAKDASEWFGTYTTGWDKVNQFVKDKGAEIGYYLTNEEGKKIIESEPEILASLMQQLTDVTNAITKGKINAEALGSLMLNLGDLDQASFDDITKYFGEYRNTLKKEYDILVKEQYTKQGELVAALMAMDEDYENNPVYQKAYADYVEMGKHLAEAVEEGVESGAEPGIRMLTEFLLEKYANANISGKLAERWSLVGDNNPLLGLDFSNMSDKDVVAQIRQWMGNALYDVNNDLGKYISAAGLNPLDFISGDAKNMLVGYIQEAFDPERAKAILSILMPDLTEALYGSTKDAVEEAGDKVEETASQFDDATESVEEYTDAIKELNDLILDGTGLTGSSKVDYFGNLFDTFGSYTVQDAMRSLGLDTSFMDEWLRNRNRTSTGTPVTTTDITNGQTTIPVVNENGSVNVDEKDVETGVKNGTSEGFNGLSDKLATVNDYLDKILKKRTTFNFYPSSSAGFFVQNSVGMSQNVTGDGP